MIAGLFNRLFRFLTAVSKSNQAARASYEVPEMDNTRDEIEEAIQAGYQNQKILQLAAAWCKNIDYTRGPLGVGMIEEMSGLPISGGSLRCDFAKAPQSFGMQLARTAVTFYEKNCVGCPDRIETNATEHLGTWAEAQIADREQREAEAAQAYREAQKASEERAVCRRLLHGQSNPASQSILDLLDRVDSPNRDPDAEHLLVKHAKMAPGDFPDALLDHLTSEAMTIGNSAFLEAAIAIFERQGRPAKDVMLDMAFLAVEKKIAPSAAGRIIAAHAQECNVETSSLPGIIKLAAGETNHLLHRQVGAEPAALLRLFDCEPDKVVMQFSSMLLDTNIWIRAHTAHAAETLVAARPDAGLLLLPVLLDSLSFQDNSMYMGDPFAVKQAVRVVADIFITNPKTSDTLIANRMYSSDPNLAKELWSCYDQARYRRPHEHVPQQVTNTIIQRSLQLLRLELDAELQLKIADTLSSASRHIDLEDKSFFSELVDLIVLWSSRLQEKDQPTDSNTVVWDIELWRESHRISAILHRLRIALEHVAKLDSDACISAIKAEWDTSDAHRTRVCFLEVFQSLVRDPTKFDLTLPFLRCALAGKSPSERAMALRVIGQIKSPEEFVPPDLVSQVWEAFEDEKLIVLFGAIHAARHIEIPKDRKSNVIATLIEVTSTYGSQLDCRYEVTAAIRLILRMVKSETYRVRVEQLVLKAINELPSEYAIDYLKGLNLEGHPAWPAAVLRVLRVDPQSERQDLAHVDVEFLLCTLARRSRSELAPHFTELAGIASERLSHKPWWAYAIADFLAFHQQHSQAADLCDSVVRMIPDTFEKRPMRDQALQIAFGHRINAAMAESDQDGVKHALFEWTQHLAGKDESSPTDRKEIESDQQGSLEMQLEVRKMIAKALDVVQSGQLPMCSLTDLSQNLLAVGRLTAPGDDRWALSEALRSLGMAAKWEPAVEAADGQASAFRDASRLIAEKVLTADRAGTWSDGVVEALKILACLETFADVPCAAASLKRAPVVFAVTDLLLPNSPVLQHQTQSETDERPTVLLHFTLNDQPISWPMALQAGMSYRVGASATVADWPRDVAEIYIKWKSAVPESVLSRSGLTITPGGVASDEGYLLARAEIPPTQGVDVTPEVTIQDVDGNRSAARIVGQRALRINTFTPSEIGIGLPMVSQRIVELLAELNAKIPSLPPDDRLNLLHLLDATSRFAALAVERKDLCDINEKRFQKELKNSLIMDHRIGGRIQEGLELGGGETDLVLERIVNELKVSRAKVTFESAQRHVNQSTQYASAIDCPISVLTILDQSPKSEPPGIQSNSMAWSYPSTHNSGLIHTPSMVAVIIIPVDFPVPSAWRSH